MNISLLAQTANSQCILNGQPIDCAELARRAKPFIGLGLGIFAAILIVSMAIFVFWLLMLIHAIKHKSPDRDTWIIVLVASFATGFGLVGALVYYFAEKKKAEAAAVTAPPAQQNQNTPPPQNTTPPQV